TRGVLRYPLGRGVIRLTNQQRRCEHDRRVQQAPFGQLVDADDLAVAIQDVGADVHAFRPWVALMREDSGDAGSNGVRITPLAPDDGPVPHPAAGDVGDGVLWSRLHR